MTIANTYEERMALIKKIADRRKMMERIRAQSKNVVKTRAKAKRAFMNIPGEDSSKNPYYYTDAPKYAQQYYGEVYHETTKLDNDWD